MPQRVLGLQPQRSDIRNLLPLITRWTSVKELVTAGDTTFFCNAIPVNATADMVWLVIDPYTSECEIKKPTDITELQITMSAFAYDHDAGDIVFVLTDAVFHAEWWGAVGDGTTDDRAAFVSAVGQIGSEGGGTLLLGGQRTYVCLGNIPIAYSSVAIRGHGSGSIIKFTHQNGTHGILIDGASTLYDNGVYDLAIYRNNNQAGVGDGVRAIDTGRLTVSGVMVY